MASYMTTMFQIARSIFQSKPVSVTEVKDISKPEEAVKNTTVSLPKEVKEVKEVKDISAPVEISVPETLKDMPVTAVKDISSPVEIISVPETLKDMSVNDTNDSKENSIHVADVKEPNIAPENVEIETEKPNKVVESAPKRKPRGKTIKK